MGCVPSGGGAARGPHTIYWWGGLTEWCGKVWCGTEEYDLALCGMISIGQYGTVRTLWYCMVRYGTVHRGFFSIGVGTCTQVLPLRVINTI